MGGQHKAKLHEVELLGQTLTPDGSDMTLIRRGNEYVILADGKALMSSRMHGSEEALATFGCEGGDRGGRRAPSGDRRVEP